MKRNGNLEVVATDQLRPYKIAMNVISNEGKQDVGRWLNSIIGARDDSNIGPLARAQVRTTPQLWHLGCKVLQVQGRVLRHDSVGRASLRTLESEDAKLDNAAPKGLAPKTPDARC